uniref:Uncharacterized protein n=1 Tax=Candidatus Kentrum sp. FM TaxID=2126340 RepID=A0A450W4I0_9GAMM|nr:MAG: hypothetical protein BECKFM1743B_GA0114221_102154 [Candidatus Kentron sp. FM]
MRLGCAVLLSGYFLFFMYAFHAAISLTYWFAIDIAIRYRYRSYPACSIASRDIDSDSERTTTTGCGQAALYYYPAISCFLCTFSCSHFPKVLVRYRYRDSLSLSILSGFSDSESRYR